MSEPVYAGISGAHLVGGAFDLGHGVKLRPIYAQVFAVPIIALQPAPPGQPSPGPWFQTEGGGFSHHVEIELSVDGSEDLPGGLSVQRTVALIASLLRLMKHTVSIPILSAAPIEQRALSAGKAKLTPFETGTRIVSYNDREMAAISVEELKWVRERWEAAARLIRSNADFDNGLTALDNCTFEGRSGSSLMLAWGALEGLFAKGGRTETTYRVCSYIASFLYAPGPARLEVFRRLKKLYAARSKVAHSAADGDLGELLETFMILRSAIIRILNRGAVPTQEFLESLLFEGK